jgi:DNA-binding transcriptional LysR family regulator
MELRHLRYFVAVAEELHFRRAAERLHVAQPAVSQQVRKLEQELGVRLFDRTQRSVSLTSSGTALLEEARRVLSAAERAQQAARNASETVTMRLRIGYLPDSLPASVPRALRRLAASAPRVHVELQSGFSVPLIEELRARRLDAVVAGLPAPTNGLRITPLEEQQVVAVLPVAHPHAVDSAIALERLAPDRLVVMPHAANPAFQATVIAMCRRAELSPTFVEVAEARVEHVLLGVAAGAGLALLPESVTQRYASPGIRFVPIEESEAAFHSVLLTHPDGDNLATFAFQRALSQPAVTAVETESRPAVKLVA